MKDLGHLGAKLDDLVKVGEICRDQVSKGHHPEWPTERVSPAIGTGLVHRQIRLDDACDAHKLAGVWLGILSVNPKDWY